MLHLERFPPKRILVVRSLPGLGDLLCSVPALRALRSAFPESQISLLGLPDQRWFGDRFAHLLDGWVDFPGYPGIPEGWQGVADIPQFLATQQEQAYDLVLQLHGNGSYINPFVTLLGARVTAGFFVPGQFCPDLYYFPYPDKEHEIWRSLRLLESLQIPLQGDHLEFPLRQADAWAHRQVAEVYGLRPESYICIHVGASGRDRRWSTSGFAAVANVLAERGYRIVLTGTAHEQSLVDTVAEQLVPQPVTLAGQTELGALAILLQQSALLICNDTGISHLAAAVGTPSVVIFSNSDPDRWAPLNRDRHRVVDVRSITTDPLKAVLAAANHLLVQPSRAMDEGAAYVG